MFENKKKIKHLVMEVSSDTRKIILNRKLKIGWNMCNSDDYIKVTRCFKCSKYNHRATECRGEQTCPRCSENHSLKECKAEQLKCINCITHNRHNPEAQINANHSPLDKNCRSYQYMIKKYTENTDY